MVSRLCLCVMAGALAAAAQKEPPVVTPGDAARAPSDAVVLFNGRDMAGWERTDGKPARCTVESAVITCVTGAGDIQTTAKFASAQIHLEFAIPYMPDQKSQMRGNSGVYLEGRYEMQILDSYQNPTYVVGMLGALYGESAPLVNAARKPNEWQSYDIVFHAHQCDAGGKVMKKGSVTVLLNGVLVQDHVEIQKIDGGCAPGPLLLQDHSGFPGAPMTAMKFRNLWYRPLEQEKTR